MEPSALSLLPPIVLIALALVTKRIFLSLGVGIVLGALLYSGWNVLATLSLLAEVAGGLVIAEGAVAEEMYILAFILMLGILTAFIYTSGGLLAFSQWAIHKVKTRVHAQFVPVLLGIIIFFDDAFSSLVGGNISRLVTDQRRISRAKLSYLVDSTAAPVIILVPISGWAAFIAATMSGILSRNDVTQYTGYEAFLLSIPTNFYAITALLFVFCVAYFGFNFGPMRRHERRAVEEGILVDTSRGNPPGEAASNLPASEDGRVGDLILPVVTLIVTTLIGTVWIGVAATDGTITPMQVLANTDVILALFYAGLITCLITGMRLLVRKFPPRQLGQAVLSGIASMLTAAAVLFLAWMTAEIMSALGIGEYVSGFISGGLLLALLPFLMFLLAAFIAFSIGSTFGTFGLLLPIAAELAVSADITLLIPMFGAVLAGAIFGDHNSPLSDTTILSSIGSGIHLMDHVTTQIPYALVCGVVSMAGYVTLGITRSIPAGLLVTVACLILAVVALRFTLPRERSRDRGIETAAE